MKNDRIGDWLWEEWDGEGHSLSNKNSMVYYTLDHVDISNDIIKRALASCLQRDGVADSLSDGFSIVENSKVIHYYIGCLDEEDVLTVCDEYGETNYGDIVENIYSATFVEF